MSEGELQRGWEPPTFNHRTPSLNDLPAFGREVDDATEQFSTFPGHAVDGRGVVSVDLVAASGWRARRAITRTRTGDTGAPADGNAPAGGS